MFDVTVIGGGPAGSAAAIRLARTGRRVRLYEKTTFPRPKLCGGFLSPESLHDLKDLNLLPALEALEAPEIHESVVVSEKGRRIASEMPEPAYSISRDSFDQMLINQAAQEGVELVWGQDGFDHLQEAPVSVIAAGRLHRGSRSLQPQALAPWYAGSQVRYVGLQANFDGTHGIADQVELDLVSSGYVGIARQKEGVHLCALTTEEVAQTHGPNLDQLLRHFVTENPALREHLKDARRISPWMSVGPVRMGIRKLSEPQTFYIGDAACVIDPFAGEGMAMGLYASRLLVKALESKDETPEAAYTALWKQTYMPALRWNAVMRALYSVAFLREPSMRMLEVFPTGMQWLTDLTRYRPLPT